MSTSIKNKKKKLREGEIIPCTYDQAFKLMWGNEEHPEVTALLISKLLNIPFEEVEGKIRFTNTKNQNLSIGDKQSDKDVTFLVDTSEPYKISLEMNFSPSALIHNSLIERNLYYLSNYFGTGLGQNTYKKLKTTIQFNFNMDFIDKEHKKLIDTYMYRNEEGHVLSDILQIVHINIAEMYDIWYNRGEEMAKYDKNMQDIIRLCACMVTNLLAEFDKALSEVDANNLLKSNMREIVDNMVNDEELCVLFYNKEEEEKKIWDSIREEMLEQVEDLAEERAKELAKDMAEKKVKEIAEEKAKELAEEKAKELAEEKAKEMVINMKNSGLSSEKISEYTKLSVDEIERLMD